MFWLKYIVSEIINDYLFVIKAFSNYLQTMHFVTCNHFYPKTAYWINEKRTNQITPSF